MGRSQGVGLITIGVDNHKQFQRTVIAKCGVPSEDIDGEGEHEARQFSTDYRHFVDHAMTSSPSFN
jgi:hypothetical protein